MAVSHRLHAISVGNAISYRQSGHDANGEVAQRHSQHAARRRRAGRPSCRSPNREAFSEEDRRCRAGGLLVPLLRAKGAARQKANDLTDTYHHIVVVCRKGKLLSISFSDTGARNTIMRAIANANSGPFLRLEQFSPAEIEAAFVESRVRTLWLSGVHRRLVIKPDAKVLSGLELESALDPLGDQSYYFSSIRSTSENEDLAVDGSPAVIGASPRQGIQRHLSRRFSRAHSRSSTGSVTPSLASAQSF